MPRFALVLLLASTLGFAQDRISEPAAAPPSRWQQEQDMLDQALRQRVLVGADARDQWIAGQLESIDPWAQAASLAQARFKVPGDKLYLASLGMVCAHQLQPLPADCDATDRLADWAIRDADNGVPVMLLADRARRRNNAEAMLGFLEEAASRPRFDDYHDRGTLVIFEALRAMPGSVEPAARAELTANYAARNSYAVQQIEALCRDAQRLPDSIRTACSNAGAAAAQRAANWRLRSAGARLAERTAAAGDPQAAARSKFAEVERRALDCSDTATQTLQSLESADPAVRARAVAQFEARLTKQGQVGE